MLFTKLVFVLLLFFSTLDGSFKVSTVAGDEPRSPLPAANARTRLLLRVTLLFGAVGITGDGVAEDDDVAADDDDVANGDVDDARSPPVAAEPDLNVLTLLLPRGLFSALFGMLLTSGPILL